MTETMLWWILSWGLIAVGLAGAVLPLLPGTGLVLAGIVLGAWIDDFQRVGPWAIGVVIFLAVASWVLDYVAALLGARRVGASKLALLGAAIGMVLGVLSGLWGLLFFPLLGAAIGEWIAHRDERRALRVGIATWIGLLLGLLAKVVLAFMMVGVFVIALLV
jgi:hypothetical protein